MNLNELPVDVLQAIQSAITDPTPNGAQREALRAANLGFHVETRRRSTPDRPERPVAPLAMEAAGTALGGQVVTLRFR